MESHSQYFFCEEKSLVLRCLRTLINGRDLPQESALRKTPPESLRWDFILRSCEDHRLLPFVSLALHKSGVLLGLAPEIQGALSKSIQSAAFENLVKRTEFEKINRVFEKRGVPVIPLKGIALTSLIYSEFPLRRMGDLDLLVRRENLEEAKSALSASGFSLKEGKYRWQTRYYDELLGRSTFASNGLVVDLQWGPRFFVGGGWVEWDAQGAWHRAERFPILGKNVFLLTGRDMARHLLFQIAGDFEIHTLSLIQLYDLALIIKKYGLGREDLTVPSGPRLNSLLEQRFASFFKIIKECFFDERDYSEVSHETREIFEFLFEGLSQAPKVFAGRTALNSLTSARDKIIFLTGYLFPSESFLRSCGKGNAIEIGVGYLKHWGEIFLKLLVLASSVFKPENRKTKPLF